MQLPPTILSLNINKKKKQDPAPAKAAGKKTAVLKAKSGSKDKSKPDGPEPPPVETTRDEDYDRNSADESDQEGDAIMKDDDDVPPSMDKTHTETSATEERVPSIANPLRRGALVPPRTLETTLFDRLEKMYGPGIKRLLNVQYR